MSAYLGRMSGNNNVEVRFALAPVQALAMKYGPAVIAVSHLNKPNAGGSSALHRVTGSGAFSAASRAVFLVVSQPDSGSVSFCQARTILVVNNRVSYSKSRSATRHPIYGLQQSDGAASQ